MFSHLLESSVPRRWSRAGVAASAVAHIVIIAAASRPAPPSPPRHEIPKPPLLYTDLQSRARTSVPTWRDAQPPVSSRPTEDRRAIPTVAIEPVPSPDVPVVRLPPVGDPFPPRPAPSGGGPSSDVTGRAPLSPPDGGRLFSAPEVDAPAAVLPGSPPPQYPAGLRAAGIEGTVRMQFVVDTAGRVDGRTVRAVSSDRPEFEAAARDAVVRARYRPAEVRGRAVPQLVEQAFLFRLDR